MKPIIILSLFSLTAALLFGCKSNEEAMKSCLDNNDIKGARSAAKRIVASGADVNTRTTRDFTPLHIAAAADDIEFAQLLISKGADVNAKIDNGATPLNFATFSGCKDSTNMIELLLKHGADINNNSKFLPPPLMTAAQNSCYEMVKYLVEHGADVNLPDSIKDTPLSYSKDIRIIKYLISKGADVNAKNLNGETVLMPIVRDYYMDTTKKKEVLLLLFEKGVDVNATYSSSIEEKYGFKPIPKTALDMVRGKDSEEIIQLLRSKGAKTAAELKAEKPAPLPAPDDKAK